MISDLFAELLEQNQLGKKGLDLFLGRSVDIGTRNIVLITEEAPLDQPEVFAGPSQDNDTFITLRVVWGETYQSSMDRGMEIYNFLRHYVTEYPWINFSLQKPVFTEKVNNGQRFKFNMLIKVKYFAEQIEMINKTLNFQL